MNRPHHLAPTFNSVRVALVCKDFSSNQVSHVGLRITADYTAKTLRQNGIWAESWGANTSQDIATKIRNHNQISLARKDVPLSHVVISAPWVASKDISGLAQEFSEVNFVTVSHSSVGFLSADPNAIKILRETSDLQMTTHNVFVGGNCRKFTDWATSAWGVNVVCLPNLYCTSENFTNRVRNWREGDTLRIGLFGANRPLKNHVSGAAGVADLAARLGTPIELFISSGRDEGGSTQAIKEITSGIPNLKVTYTGWLTWPDFRRLLRTLDLVFQVSHTESFNVVTADSISEGVPVVVGPAINWAPKDWVANPDEPCDISLVAERLLRDKTTTHRGHKALAEYIDGALVTWKKFLCPNQ